MALMENVNSTTLLITAALVFLGAACFLFVWWVEERDRREDERYHSYEPLPPKEDDED